MKKIEIICDECGSDLTSHDDGTDEFMLCLSCSLIPNISDTRYCMVYHPILDRDYHFCGLGCLREWLIGGEEKKI